MVQLEALPQLLASLPRGESHRRWELLAEMMRELTEPYCLECGARFPRLRAGMHCPNCESRKPLVDGQAAKPDNGSAVPRGSAPGRGWRRACNDA
jgi:hypothetical protein